MRFEDYLKDIPKLHTWDAGKTWTSGGFSPEQLLELHDFTKKQGRALSFIESGAGNSTLTFLFSQPSEVVSIAPDQELFGRISSCMKAYSLDASKVNMINDSSEWALPRLAQQQNEPVFDICLIDGEHNYPNVFLDFFYMNHMMKKGGVMLIDDTQIYSCNQLSLFLSYERDFELVFDIGKLRGYRRTSDRRILSGWKSGYNMAMMKSQ